MKIKTADNQQEDANVLLPNLKTAIRVSNLSDAKRLQARIIYEFQLGSIQASDAKTLSYLLQNYSTLHQSCDIEIRLEKLEANQEK